MRIYYYLSVFTTACLLACTKQQPKLFEKVSSSHSNISFVNSLSATANVNALNFTNFYNGGGIGLGNFNGDSLPDIVFTANQQQPELYINKGGLRFDKLGTETGLKLPKVWANGVAVVDINSDGWDDMYICTASNVDVASNKNLLYINQKTSKPSFKEAAASYGLDYAGYSTQAAFFDYDLDGDLDAFLLNTDPDGANPSVLNRQFHDGYRNSCDKLFRNDSGHYVDVSIPAGIRYEGLGLGLAIADYNADGWPDIYCSNDFQSSDILYLNKKDGSFENIIKSATGHNSLFGMGVDAADLNNDGRIDILQLDMLPEGNERQKQMISGPGYEKQQLSLTEPYNYQRQYMRNNVQLNAGNVGNMPIFQEAGLQLGIAKTDWSWAPLIADFDADGHKDVFISNGYRKNVTDLDFITYHSANRQFGNAQSQYEDMENLMRKVPEIKLNNYAYKNTGQGSFKNVSEQWGLDELSYASAAAYADLDLDGDLDIICSNIDEEASLFENKSSKGNYLNLTLESNKPQNKKAIGARLKVYSALGCQTFENQPLRTYLSTMPTSIYVGLGSNTVADSVQIFWPGGTIQTLRQLKPGRHHIKEVDAKPQQNTIAEQPIFTLSSHSIDNRHQESSFNDFNYQATIHKMLSKNGPAMAKGDFNGDRLEDLVIGGSFNGSKTAIFFQKPDGSFGTPLPLNQLNMEVGTIVAFDADGDKDLDILLTTAFVEPGSPAPETLLLINNKATFNVHKKLPAAICSMAALAVDMDQDQDLDLIIGGYYAPGAYPVACDSYILENNGGNFTQIPKAQYQSFSKIGAITDLAIADLDNNNTMELIVVGQWMAPTVFGIEKHGLQLITNSLAPKGLYNTVAVADLQADGLPEILLGNEGLNTTLQASINQPITLRTADYNHDGLMDPILGHYLMGKQVAYAPLGSLSRQLVQIKKQYTSYNAYAEADYNDLFEDLDTKNELQLRAEELQSLLLINKGKLHFGIQTLPAQVQLSPVHKILCEDFNHDGKKDVLCIGNFYHNESLLGAQDASLGSLLLGDGKGGLTSTGINTSGLHIRADYRKALCLGTKLILSVNSSYPIIYSFKP